MKNIYIIFLLISITNCRNSSKSDLSQIEFNASEIKRIAYLCEVWGGLKYFTINTNIYPLKWDNILVENMVRHPDFYKNKHNLNEIIKSITSNLKPEHISNEKISTDSLSDNKAFQWIHDTSMVDTDVLTYLSSIINNSHKVVNNAYIKFSDAATPDCNFDKEEGDENNALPDYESRFIGLFRYWNMVNYFYPYKNLIDGDWEEILATFIPKIIGANNLVDYQYSFLQLFQKLNDGHAFSTCNFTNAWFDTYKPNFRVINSVIYKDKKEPHIINTGDIIISVNNILIDSLSRYLFGIIPSSNKNYTQTYIDKLILDYADFDSLNLKIKRGNKIISINTSKSELFTNYLPNLNTDTIKYKVYDNEILYINCGVIKSVEIRKALSLIKKENQKVILDLRKYPVDDLLDSIWYYLNDYSKPFVAFQGIDPQFPSKIINLAPYNTLNRGKNSPFKLKKCVILVNENTMSHGEFSTMAYQTLPNTVTIGNTTAGADGDIVTISIAGGITTNFSGIAVFYPDGTQTQRIGVKIDVYSKNANNDTLISEAIRYFSK